MNRQGPEASMHRGCQIRSIEAVFMAEQPLKVGGKRFDKDCLSVVQAENA
jgi:hypothetical protein